MDKKLNVAVYLYDGYYETEVALASLAFKKENLFTMACGCQSTVAGTDGRRMVVDRSVESLTADDVDVVIIPGGTPSAEPEILRLLQACEAKGKLIGGICGGVDLMAYAGLLSGRRFTSYYEREKTYPHLPSDGVLTYNNYENDRKVITASYNAYLELAAVLAMEAGVMKEEELEGYVEWFKQPFKL